MVPPALSLVLPLQVAVAVAGTMLTTAVQVVLVVVQDLVSKVLEWHLEVLETHQLHLLLKDSLVALDHQTLLVHGTLVEQVVAEAQGAAVPQAREAAAVVAVGLKSEMIVIRR